VDFIDINDPLQLHYKTENVREHEWCKKDNKPLLVSDCSEIECEVI
jgi:hypothetical protein